MSFLRPARRLLAGLIIVSALLSAVAPGTSHAADLGMSDQSYVTLMGNVSTVLDTTVRAYMNRDSLSDTRYYADGLWTSDVMSCPACNMGPAVGAAVLSRDQPALLPVVTASVDRAIRDHQRANGAFYGDGNSDGIQTAWYAALIGEIYLTTEDRLDADTESSLDKLHHRRRGLAPERARDGLVRQRQHQPLVHAGPVDRVEGQRRRALPNRVRGVLAVHAQPAAATLGWLRALPDHDVDTRRRCRRCRLPGGVGRLRP